MKNYLVANWKINPQSSKECLDLISKYEIKSRHENLEIVVCPPFLYLEYLTANSGNLFEWGAQDCFWEKGGAYTGEVSPHQLKALGVKYVILGHSERRENLEETDEMVNKKVRAVLRAKMNPILCVGGGREAMDPKSDSQKIVLAQLGKNLANVQKKDFSAGQLIVSYEPPWALSTVSGNVSASPKLAAEVAFAIKHFLNSTYGKQGLDIPIIYGGSANASNVSQFIKKPNLDGFLVGGASLNPPEFKKMISLLK